MAKPNVGNRYGRKGIQAPWDAIKAVWCSGSKSCKEIAAMFGINQGTIETRASRERWALVRDRVLKEKKAQDKRGGPAGVRNVYAKYIPPSKPIEKIEDIPRENSTEYGLSRSENNPNAQKVAPDEAVVQRALAIVDSTKFRERVIAVNEKSLSVLEKSLPTSVGEVDRFAEALTKVERIGARTYGYDKESEHPIINIGVLTSGAEYD